MGGTSQPTGGFLAQYNFNSKILQTMTSYNPVVTIARVNSKILKTITVDSVIN